ncbi:mucin-5AC-like [Micropterus dolomieu]|uniref:mucin-5AC-like n=1 Tax=Micropterus dolomieu TaxID=147949 RepID=UPI001E8CC78E|nr:mucin-5AC-like [Micropterus dolomieu]
MEVSNGVTSAPDETMATSMTSAPDETMATNMTSAPDETMATSMTSAPDESMATNMTSAPDESMATNMTSAPDESMATSMTSAPDESMATNMTSAPDESMETNMTSAPDESMATSMTSAPDESMETNMTSAPDESMATNMTSAPDESMATNMTSAPNAPMATNMTAEPTTAALVTPYIIPVGYLQTPLSRAECGTQQLCVSAPAVCDPSSDTTCYFIGVKRQSGQNFEFALSGQSTGYTANSLSPDGTLGGNDSAYVCANDGGVVRFFTTVLSKIQLIETKLNVSSVMGRVDGTRIQCTFVATLPTTATKSATVYALTVLTGSFNRHYGNLGTPVVQLLSPLLDLGNPYVTNKTATSGMTSVHATTLQQSLTQALLITVGVLGLAIL